MKGTEETGSPSGKQIKKMAGPIVDSSNRGPLNWRVGGFGRPTKMTTYLKSLLEINFLHPLSKYGDDSPFSHPTGVALIISLVGFQFLPNQNVCMPIKFGLSMGSCLKISTSIFMAKTMTIY